MTEKTERYRMTKRGRTEKVHKHPSHPYWHIPWTQHGQPHIKAMTQEFEKALRLSSYLSLAELIQKGVTEERLRQIVRRKNIFGLAYMTATKHRHITIRHAPSLAAAFEHTLSLEENPEVTTYLLKRRPMRFWAFVWLSYGKTRARRIFKEVFEK